MKVAGTDDAAGIHAGPWKVPGRAQRQEAWLCPRTGGWCTTSDLNTSSSIRTSEYHRLRLRWVQQKTIFKEPVGDVIRAVDQLRRTIETLRLDGNVGLNVISILVNTGMMGYGNVAYRSNIQWEQQWYESCETPDLQGAGSDLSPPAATYRERPDTNDSQSNAEPFIPNVCWSMPVFFHSQMQVDFLTPQLSQVICKICGQLNQLR